MNVDKRRKKLDEDDSDQTAFSFDINVMFKVCLLLSN